MAAFIAKQMIGSKLDSVKEAFQELAGDKKEGEEKTGPTAEEEAELLEARREEEERRRNKYAKMEADREKVRQGIREKYKIEKKEEPVAQLPVLENSLNAKKKSPAQLAIDAEDDEFNPIKMATDLFGTVKTSLANIPFPWNKTT